MDEAHDMAEGDRLPHPGPADDGDSLAGIDVKIGID
jgi:hypothetical protein